MTRCFVLICHLRELSVEAFLLTSDCYSQVRIFCLKYLEHELVKEKFYIKHTYKTSESYIFTWVLQVS